MRALRRLRLALSRRVATQVTYSSLLRRADRLA